MPTSAAEVAAPRSPTSLPRKSSSVIAAAMDVLLRWGLIQPRLRIRATPSRRVMPSGSPGHVAGDHVELLQVVGEASMAEAQVQHRRAEDPVALHPLEERHALARVGRIEQ